MALHQPRSMSPTGVGAGDGRRADPTAEWSSVHCVRMPSTRFFVVLVAVECVAILVAWVTVGYAGRTH